jgi:hypothetical protein
MNLSLCKLISRPQLLGYILEPKKTLVIAWSMIELS